MWRRVVPAVLPVAVCLSLAGCYRVQCSLNPPVAPAPPTGAPLVVSTYSFSSSMAGKDAYARVLRQTLASYRDPALVPLDDSDKSHHLHVVAYDSYLDLSGLGYLGYLTLLLVPLSHTYEAAYTFRYTHYVGGVPVRESRFCVRERVTQWILYTPLWFSPALRGAGKELCLFEESVRSFLDGSGGEGALLDGLACVEPCANRSATHVRKSLTPGGPGATAELSASCVHSDPERLRFEHTAPEDRGGLRGRAP